MARWFYISFLASWVSTSFAMSGNHLFAIKKACSQRQPTSSSHRYEQLRAKILDTMALAEKQITLVTRFLGDGDISSALYLSNYRKIKTHVVLDKRQVAHFRSRLYFLKTQKIPFSVADLATFLNGEESLLLVDQEVYLIDSSISLNRRKKPYTITSCGHIQSGALRRHVHTLAKKKTSPRTLTPKKRKKVQREPIYRYSRKQDKRPSYIPTKLPNVPKWKKDHKTRK